MIILSARNTLRKLLSVIRALVHVDKQEQIQRTCKTAFCINNDMTIVDETHSLTPIGNLGLDHWLPVRLGRLAGQSLSLGDEGKLRVRPETVVCEEVTTRRSLVTSLSTACLNGVMDCQIHSLNFHFIHHNHRHHHHRPWQSVALPRSMDLISFANLHH